MKSSHICFTIAASAVMTMRGLDAAAPEATVKIGDPAPKLQTGEFVQGEPVKEFAKGQAYIVEFWATWCGPCKATIPHVNEIHKKYAAKGLTVIGQDCWERDATKVPGFVKEMGDKMTYRVAYDDMADSAKGKMAETWMAAAGQNGIPCAFVIGKDQHIAWIGHPATLDDKIIESILAGSYDVKKAAAEKATADASRAQISEFSRKASTAMRAKNWDEAQAATDELEKLLPAAQRLGIDMMRLDIAVGRKDAAAVAKMAGQISDSQPKNFTIQNAVAWKLATAGDVNKSGLEVAEKIARLGLESAGDNASPLLDTMARIKFRQGEKDEAVKLEQQALDKATDDRLKKNLEKTLSSYKEGKLPPGAGE